MLKVEEILVAELELLDYHFDSHDHICTMIACFIPVLSHQERMVNLSQTHGYTLEMQS